MCVSFKDKWFGIEDWFNKWFVNGLFYIFVIYIYGKIRICVILCEFFGVDMLYIFILNEDILKG